MLGQTKTYDWILAIYQSRAHWLHSQAPLSTHKFLHLRSFADKQTRDESHVVQLKFIAGSKLSFACASQSQKMEWLTAIQKALSEFLIFYIIINFTVHQQVLVTAVLIKRHKRAKSVCTGFDVIKVSRFTHR